MSSIFITIENCTQCVINTNRKEKSIKGIKIEIEVKLFTENLIVYLQTLEKQ